MQIRNLTLLTLLAGPLCAQPWDSLAKFGVPLQPAFPGSTEQFGFRDDTRRLTIGFGALVPIKGRLGFEVNSMWRSARMVASQVDDSLLEGVRYQVFDIPMLGRIKLHERGRTQLFTSGGYVLRSIRVMSEVSAPLRTSSERYWRHGGAVGGGVSIRLGWVCLEPEYRFTAIRGGLGLRNPHDLLIGLRVLGYRATGP